MKRYLEIIVLSIAFICVDIFIFQRDIEKILIGFIGTFISSCLLGFVATQLYRKFRPIDFFKIWRITFIIFFFIYDYYEVINFK